MAYGIISGNPRWQQFRFAGEDKGKICPVMRSRWGKGNAGSQLESTCSRNEPMSTEMWYSTERRGQHSNSSVCMCVPVCVCACVCVCVPLGSPRKDSLWSWFRKWFNPGPSVLPRTASFQRSGSDQKTHEKNWSLGSGPGTTFMF